VRGYDADVYFCVFDVSVEEIGVGFGFRFRIGFRLKSKSKSNSKSKSKSNTKLLNRDIKDTEVNIYNIASHKGLKGEIDTRLLTKNWI
jgi:hypothetical protein